MSLLWQPFPMPRGRRAHAWHHHPSTRKPAHFHEEPELNLVYRGRATFVIGDRHVNLEAGALLWYPPGLDHYLEYASDDLELFVVGFQRDLLDAFSREHGSVPNFTRPLHTLDDSILRASVETLGASRASSDGGAVEQRLLGVLATLDQTSPGPTLGLRAASLLLDAPARGRDELARGLASNRGDVSRRFHGELGLPLVEFKNRQRTLKLISLFEAGQTNLMRAALQAGFGSYSSCHQVVRKTFGITPRELADAAIRRSMDLRFDPMHIG